MNGIIINRTKKRSDAYIITFVSHIAYKVLFLHYYYFYLYNSKFER